MKQPSRGKRIVSYQNTNNKCNSMQKGIYFRIINPRNFNGHIYFSLYCTFIIIISTFCLKNLIQNYIIFTCWSHKNLLINKLMIDYSNLMIYLLLLPINIARSTKKIKKLRCLSLLIRLCLVQLVSWWLIGT